MFGQLPALVDPAYGTIVQSNAILRYLGRKLDIYGDDPTFTDMVLDGVEDWRSPYATLIYTDKLAAEALETYPFLCYIFRHSKRFLKTKLITI